MELLTKNYKTFEKKKGPPTEDHYLAKTLMDKYGLTFPQAYFGIVKKIGKEGTREAIKGAEGKGVKYLWGIVRNHKPVFKEK